MAIFDFDFSRIGTTIYNAGKMIAVDTLSFIVTLSLFIQSLPHKMKMTYQYKHLLGGYLHFKMKQKCLEYMDCGTITHNDGYSQVVYYEADKKFIVRIPKATRRGPSMISKIFDENGTDVTSEVITFMGPSHNFHGITTTPHLLGYEKLSFQMLRGLKVFEKNDVIMIY